MKAGRNKAMVLIYASFMIMAIIAFISLAVDWGRVQGVKTELQDAADAASRYAALGISDGTYLARAQTSAAENTVGGQSLVLQAGDVTEGTWNTTLRTFTAGGATPNAIRVYAYHSAARGNAVPLVFGCLIGRSTNDVQATSIAMAITIPPTPLSIPGSACIYFSGMPSGTTEPFGDTATNCPPVLANGIPLVPGSQLTFTAGGMMGFGPIPTQAPGGKTSNCFVPSSINFNGMSGENAPLGALEAVFLDNTQPDLTSSPAVLDFSTSAARDYTGLAPQLKQAFFIGDGQTSTGIPQSITVPAGATRLFLGTHDGHQWNDNGGAFVVTVQPVTTVVTVK